MVECPELLLWDCLKDSINGDKEFYLIHQASSSSSPSGGGGA